LLDRIFNDIIKLFPQYKSMSVYELEEKEKTVKYFKNLLHSDRLPQSLLLYGGNVEKLETAAKYLAKILNCENPPVKGETGGNLECCDSCSSCRRIQEETYPDVYWIRPESKLRQITVDSIRELIREIQLKPLEGKWKVAVIVAADRMHQNAANAFLKTLEEPPAHSLIILITIEPHRLLPTILSRCQKINLTESDIQQINQFKDFLQQIASLILGSGKEVLGRYKLLDLLVQKLNEIRDGVEQNISSGSPEKRFKNVEIDSQVLEKWQKEAKSLIESEYRRQRQELFKAVQWLFRDIWLQTIKDSQQLLALPELADYTSKIANKITPEDAKLNLEIFEDCQRLFFTNVQEMLILEVTLLRLQF